MTHHLKPYPSYRDSGLPWLGKIPTGWTEKRAKYYFREVDERSTTGAEQLLSVSHISGVTRRKETVTMFLAETNIGHKVCRPGDVVINTMWAWMAALGVSRQLGLVSPSYSVYRPLDSSAYVPTYLDHLLRTHPYASEYRCRSTGIRTSRLRLYPDKFLDIRFVCPPYEEQLKIVSFLGAQDRVFKHFIAKKWRLIELLKEQKYRIISDAVTKGLRSGIRLKSSGVDWIGDIPHHWSINRLKYLTRFDNGIAFKPNDWKEEGVPIIRIQNLNGSQEFNYTDRQGLPNHLLIKPGELLFSWSGNRGTSFGPFIWDRSFSAYLNQHIFKLSGYRGDLRFFYYMLLAVTRHVEEETHGIIGLVHITKPELGAISVAVPPAEEQKEIATSLDVACSEIDLVIRQAQHEVNLVREYRALLIADVVTGKLDVRGVDLPVVEEQAEGPVIPQGEDINRIEEEAGTLNQETYAEN